MKIKNYYKKLNTIALSAIVSMSSSLCLGALTDKQKKAVCEIMNQMMKNYEAWSFDRAQSAEEYKQRFAELGLLEEDWNEEVEFNDTKTTIKTTINKELKKYEQNVVCKIIENMMDVYTSNFATPSYILSIETYIEKFNKLNLKEEDWNEEVEVNGIKTTINKELRKYENLFNTCKNYLKGEGVYKNGIESQEASEKLLKPVVIIPNNNTVFPKEAAIALCTEMRKQALELNNVTSVRFYYDIFCRSCFMVGGMVSIKGFFTPILIEDESTKIDDEFAQFNVVQTLKNTLGDRLAKIKEWKPKNYREAIIALCRYEADLNAQVEDYNQGEWFVGSVSNVLQSLMKDYEVVFELDKTKQCSLTWMQDSVYGKTCLIYEFFTFNCPTTDESISIVLSAAKLILAEIAGSSDYDRLLENNEDVNVNVLKCITLGKKTEKAPTSVWGGLGTDIPCDTFFKLVIQIANHLGLTQRSVNAENFYNMISWHSSFNDAEKNILKALFTCCVVKGDSTNYDKLKNKLTEKGVLTQDNQ